jgi:hypothetical protein
MKVSSRRKQAPPPQQREEAEAGEQGSPPEAEAMDAAAGVQEVEVEEAGCSGKAPEAEGRTVVVGVRADAESRALLTWVLVNVAAPLDRVVAVHVALPSAAEAPDFDAMLAVYQGFCNLKQVAALCSAPLSLSISLRGSPWRPACYAASRS